MAAGQDIPSGFTPLQVLSAFPQAVGAFYFREENGREVIAVRAEARRVPAE